MQCLWALNGNCEYNPEEEARKFFGWSYLGLLSIRNTTIEQPRLAFERIGVGKSNDRTLSRICGKRHLGHLVHIGVPKFWGKDLICSHLGQRRHCPLLYSTGGWWKETISQSSLVGTPGFSPQAVCNIVEALDSFRHEFKSWLSSFISCVSLNNLIHFSQS